MNWRPWYLLSLLDCAERWPLWCGLRSCSLLPAVLCYGVGVTAWHFSPLFSTMLTPLASEDNASCTFLFGFLHINFFFRLTAPWKFLFLLYLRQIALLGLWVLAGCNGPVGLGMPCSRLFWLSNFLVRNQVLFSQVFLCMSLVGFSSGRFQ